MFSEEIKNARLNASQRKFCKSPITKNIRLLAPAGSGKTFSLLWRCAYIDEQYQIAGKAKPNFLLVTFTKSACFELEQRLSQSKEFSSVQATVRTLNAWGWEHVCQAGNQLCNSSSDRISLVQHDLSPVCEQFPEIKKAVSGKAKIVNSKLLIELIDVYKSLGFEHTMNQKEYANQIKYLQKAGLGNFWTEKLEELHFLLGTESESKNAKKEQELQFFKFWKKATTVLEKVHRFTFEDQKYWACFMLEQRIAANSFDTDTSKFDFILVDEFQDINPLDLKLIQNIRLFYGKGKAIPLTIVGDDDQAIFGWRGSTPNFIIHPEEYFQGAFVTCILDMNYRSPQNIVAYSDKLIRHNKGRVAKEMKSQAKGRAYIKVISRKTYLKSLDSTIRLAHELIEEKGCEQVALIGRRQAQLFPFQVLLSAEKTNYNVATDIDIFEGEAMKSLMEIIRIVYRAKDNDCDDPINDLLQICDKMFRYKLSRKDRQEISIFLEKNGSQTFEDAVNSLEQYPVLIKETAATDIVKKIRKLVHSKTVFEFMNFVETDMHGFDKDYEKRVTDNHYKEPQFFRLTELARRYGEDFRQFRQDIENARNGSNRSRIREEIETIKIPINLVTATRSKGKEFDAVIILDAEDDQWPIKLEDDLEEERRLFYVAMTRAKKYLYFTVTASSRISRFIFEAGIVDEAEEQSEKQSTSSESKEKKQEQSKSNYETNFFAGCTTWAQVKTRYKALVKAFHPDGSAGDSDLMKLVNHQYEKLEKEYRFRR